MVSLVAVVVAVLVVVMVTTTLMLILMLFMVAIMIIMDMMVMLSMSMEGTLDGLVREPRTNRPRSLAPLWRQLRLLVELAFRKTSVPSSFLPNSWPPAEAGAPTEVGPHRGPGAGYPAPELGTRAPPASPF